jgi:methyl-accepting chemotaxis protein
MIDYKTPSISTRLTVSLVALIVLLSAIFLGIYYYQITENTAWQLEKTSDKYISSIAGTLEVPLWDMDRENINTICNYYIQNEWVVMLKLTSSSGEVMFQKRTKNTFDQAYVVNRTRDLFYGGESIGNVEIVLDTQEFHKENLKSLRGMVTGLLISVACLIAFTGFLLNKIIKEPMAGLERIAESYSKGDYHPRWDSTPYKEFDTFVSVLFAMGDTIEKQINELMHAEESLRKHRDSLEETVAERTKELEISNKNLQNEIKNRRQAQRIRIDRESEASHDLIRLLNKPGIQKR